MAEPAGCSELCDDVTHAYRVPSASLRRGPKVDEIGRIVDGGGLENLGGGLDLVVPG